MNSTHFDAIAPQLPKNVIQVLEDQLFPTAFDDYYRQLESSDLADARCISGSRKLDFALTVLLRNSSSVDVAKFPIQAFAAELYRRFYDLSGWSKDSWTAKDILASLFANLNRESFHRRFENDIHRELLSSFCDLVSIQQTIFEKIHDSVSNAYVRLKTPEIRVEESDLTSAQACSFLARHIRELLFTGTCNCRNRYASSRAPMPAKPRLAELEAECMQGTYCGRHRWNELATVGGDVNACVRNIVFGHLIEKGDSPTWPSLSYQLVNHNLRSYSGTKRK